MASRFTSTFSHRLLQHKTLHSLHPNHPTLFPNPLFHPNFPPSDHHLRLFSTARRHPNHPPKLHTGARFTSRFIHRLLQHKTHNSLHPNHPFHPKVPPSDHLRRFFSTARRHPNRPPKLDIGARARQMQNRRLWTYAITFSCIAGFIIIVLNQFEDQLVFYVTPTDALSKYIENPSKNKFRLGGLVLEGSVAHPAASHEIEFVITDLITDMLVRYEGQVPDLFREGHSVVVEGFVKPITNEIKNEVSEKSVSGKARSVDCYFSASEVLAKHDEKYMPAEVANAIEKNKKKLAEEAGDRVDGQEAVRVS